MATEGSFLHGVEVLEIDSGARPIRTVRSSVIGIVGTAPNADPVAFPYNTPVVIAGSRMEAARLDMTGTGEGTLPAALDSILDQIGAVIVVVRVEDEDDAQATLANVIGGVDANTGEYRGVQAFLASESINGFAPRILIAPGFTHNRTSGGLTNVTITDPGSGYTEPPVVTFEGGGTAIGKVLPTATAVLGTGANADKVVSVTITSLGQNMTAAPTITFSGGGGSGAMATGNIGSVGNAVVAELIGIAERMRAVIFADGPNTNDTAAINYGKDFGSKRVYVVDPKVLKTDTNANIVTEWGSAIFAGIQAKVDNDMGFWWSVSNKTINGIVGTARAIDFKMGDANCRANLLNENNIATIINEDGYRTWGNRTLSDDPKWAFLSVVRTADMINDSLQRAHLWAVDRNITRTYVEDVTNGVNAYLRTLVTLGAILGGECWADPDLNTAANITQGHVYFDFDFTPPYPAERITFRSRMVDNYIETIFTGN